jgi:hypothetical protein
MLSLIPKDSPPLDGIKSQPPLTDVTSPEALRQARTWLDDCDKHHIHCSRQESPILPNRILDIGSNNAPGFIKLIESNNSNGDYVALSYCWGGDQKTILTHRRYNEFLNGLALDSLPQTILDAIEVTRKLDIRYLWIDALCIIQDSHNDKQHEIVHMDAIYNNSYVTISAASAASASIGFLHRRPQLHSQPLEIPLRLQPRDEVATSIMYDDSQLPLFEIKNNPIEQRGWTLQEKLLSRRVLFYGATRLQWICRSIPLEPGQSEVLQGSFLANTQDSGDRVQNWDHNWRLYRGWEQTITELTRRSLTHPEDALRAVAGIASKYQKELRDGYVAGLWRRALVGELLWCGRLVRDRERLQPRPPRYIAPSWSWASHQGEISFLSQQPDAVMATVVVKDCSIVLMNSEMPFGDIVGGQITICAPVKTARLVSWALFDLQPETDKVRGNVCIDGREDLHSDFRRSRTVVNEFDIVTCLRLTEEWGLVLRQVSMNKYTGEQRSRKYRRIGCFQSYSKEWLGDCKREQIIIV